MLANIFYRLSLVIVLSFASLSAHAEYLYTYTGNNFNYFANDKINNPFTSSNSVSFSFTTNELVTNSSIALASISGWSASDGLHNFTDANSWALDTYGSNVYFNTDSQGEIASWFFIAQTRMTSSYPNVNISSNSIRQMRSVGHENLYAGEYVQVNPAPGNIGYYSGISDLVGTWSVAAVPEADTLSMVLLGGVLLGFMARRRKAS